LNLAERINIYLQGGKAGVLGWGGDGCTNLALRSFYSFSGGGAFGNEKRRVDGETEGLRKEEIVAFEKICIPGLHGPQRFNPNFYFTRRSMLCF
jgi:hypothetical protein